MTSKEMLKFMLGDFYEEQFIREHEAIMAPPPTHFAGLTYKFVKVDTCTEDPEEVMA